MDRRHQRWLARAADPTPEAEEGCREGVRSGVSVNTSRPVEPPPRCPGTALRSPLTAGRRLGLPGPIPWVSGAYARVGRSTILPCVVDTGDVLAATSVVGAVDGGGGVAVRAVPVTVLRVVQSPENTGNVAAVKARVTADRPDVTGARLVAEIVTAGETAEVMHMRGMTICRRCSAGGQSVAGVGRRQDAR